MSTPPSPPRLLDLVRQVALSRFGQDGPAQRYVDWTRRLILFHDKRHPRELSPGDVGRFLEHVAHTEKDVLNCLEQAHTALTFLYHDVLGLAIGELPLPEPPRLLDRLRHACRVRQYSPRTEKCYAEWAERFIRFHGLRHPNTMGGAEIEQFLTDLAVNGQVAASTQNQAFHALLFLYQQVLGIELPRLDALRAKRPKRLPSVLSPDEVRRFLDAVEGGDGLYRKRISHYTWPHSGLKPLFFEGNLSGQLLSSITTKKHRAASVLPALACPYRLFPKPLAASCRPSVVSDAGLRSALRHLTPRSVECDGAQGFADRLRWPRLQQQRECNFSGHACKRSARAACDGQAV